VGPKFSENTTNTPISVVNARIGELKLFVISETSITIYFRVAGGNFQKKATNCGFVNVCICWNI
jgi:hypothetical protein